MSQQYCYGKKAAVRPHSLKTLSHYLKASLPEPPEQVDYYSQIRDWPMDGNDRKGDCVLAGADHLNMAWDVMTGDKLEPMGEANVVQLYDQLSPRDEGLVLADALELWRTKGILGDRIFAYVPIDPHNAKEIKQAMWLFGGLLTGFQVPSNTQDLFNEGKDWDVTLWGNQIVGGHCVPLLGFSVKAQKLISVTWARIQAMTWRFSYRYMDEMYAIIPEEFVRFNKGPVPNLDLHALLDDLEALSKGGGQVPPAPPAPAPPAPAPVPTKGKTIRVSMDVSTENGSVANVQSVFL